MTERCRESTVRERPEVREIQARVNAVLLNRMMAERYFAYMPNVIRLDARRVERR